MDNNCSGRIGSWNILTKSKEEMKEDFEKSIDELFKPVIYKYSGADERGREVILPHFNTIDEATTNERQHLTMEEIVEITQKLVDKAMARIEELKNNV